MVYIKINNTLYPALIETRLNDYDWGGRESKIIHLTMSAADAVQLFIDDVPWSVVEELTNENQEVIQNEYDNSEYCVAGTITDYRDGKITVKMGKLTDKETLAIIMGGNI